LEEGAVTSEAEAACSYRIEASRKPPYYYQRGHRGRWTPELNNSSKNEPSDSLKILSSPTAASGPGGPQGRLLPNVPKRFVVPRVSAAEFKNRVSFEDENNAVTHLGGPQIRQIIKIHVKSRVKFENFVKFDFKANVI